MPKSERVGKPIPIFIIMKNVLFAIGFFLMCATANRIQAQEFELIHIVLTTGGDDLRGGNSAYISLNFLDGTSSDEISITDNTSVSGSFGNNGMIVGDLVVGDVEDLSNVKSITIRHDGSPRKGQPFDTYDNWDLKAIRVSALTDGSGSRGVNIYNSRNDPDHRNFVDRFTGDVRTVTLLKQ